MCSVTFCYQSLRSWTKTYFCLCLCFGFLQMQYSRPFLRTILQFRHIFLTAERILIVYNERPLGYSCFGNVRPHTSYIIILSPVYQNKPSLLVRLAIKHISSKRLGSRGSSTTIPCGLFVIENFRKAEWECLVSGFGGRFGLVRAIARQNGRRPRRASLECPRMSEPNIPIQQRQE